VYLFIAPAKGAKALEFCSGDLLKQQYYAPTSMCVLYFEYDFA